MESLQTEIEGLSLQRKQSLSMIEHLNQIVADQKRNIGLLREAEKESQSLRAENAELKQTVESQTEANAGLQSQISAKESHILTLTAQF